jgi:hypothetical protein
MNGETDLQIGASYWIDFVHPTKGSVKFPTTIVVGLDGKKTCMSASGVMSESLPEKIVRATRMNSFQYLRWLSRAAKREGKNFQAEHFMQRAYKAMDDQFYMDRIQHLFDVECRYMGIRRAWRSPIFIEFLNELQLFRPDLPISDIPCVRQAWAERDSQGDALMDQVLANLNEDSEPVQAPAPSLWSRIRELFRGSK